jgi:pilus assembly protein Flp/PilA
MRRAPLELASYGPGGSSLISIIRRLLDRARSEEGQGLVEYALILVLVSIVVILILALLGGTIVNVFSDIVSNFH